MKMIPIRIIFAISFTTFIIYVLILSTTFFYFLISLNWVGNFSPLYTSLAFPSVTLYGFGNLMPLRNKFESVGDFFIRIPNMNPCRDWNKVIFRSEIHVILH